MQLQHLQHVTSALLVTFCVFQVKGLPSSSVEESERFRAKLAHALTVVHGDFLSKTLDLNKEDFLDVSDTFGRLFVALAEGKINHEIAIVFLQNCASFLPKTSKAMQAVAYMMFKIKERADNGQETDVNSLLINGLKFYLGYDSKRSRQMWGAQAPVIYQAAFNEEAAPQNVVNFLATQYEDFQELQGTDCETQLELLQKATEDTLTYATFVKLTANFDD